MNTYKVKGAGSAVGETAVIEASNVYLDSYGNLQFSRTVDGEIDSPYYDSYGRVVGYNKIKSPKTVYTDVFAKGEWSSYRLIEDEKVSK